MSFFKGKSILITGGVGTVGKELIKQILCQQPSELRVIDTNESGVFFLEEEFGESYRAYAGDKKNDKIPFSAYIGDIRDPDKLNRKMDGIDIVFHAAALKHVILCEKSPFDAVQTNIMGVKNIINAALLNKVKHVLFTSSDKAVNPTSVMGTSKLMGERLISAANSLKFNRNTIFTSTRFGNVIGSRGSVVPIFYRQIRNGGPLTITDNRMTRFVMTIEESVKLVLKSVELAKGGEVFVTKMPVMQIKDLAQVMIDLVSPRFGFQPEKIKIKEIGIKAGEKLYEELMTDEETTRTIELENMFAVKPAFDCVYEDIKYSYPETISQSIDNPYNSATEKVMNYEEIKKYFIKNQIIEKLEQAEE
ncbi:MAG: polysaccharide biosynthesis protein [Deltaproteobacteria bacterium]|nr:polysaccharide biosynthesis protein [Deltaproteobacteria bacterium]